MAPCSPVVGPAPPLTATSRILKTWRLGDFPQTLNSVEVTLVTAVAALAPTGLPRCWPTA